MLSGVRVDSKYGASAAPADEWQRSAHGYRVTVRYGGRRASFDYWMGPALCRDPERGEVLSCLALDARAGEMSFTEFCDEFGYDDDSRRAWEMWQACRRTADRLRRVFGDQFGTFLATDWEGGVS